MSECMTRREQAKRKKNVFAYFKTLQKTLPEGTTKDSMYKKVAEEFGYQQLNSVKNIISELKRKEDEERKNKFLFAEGFVHGVMSSFKDYCPEFATLDFKFEVVKVSDECDVAFINASFSNKTNSITEIISGFEHFSLVRFDDAKARLYGFLEESVLKSQHYGN